MQDCPLTTGSRVTTSLFAEIDEISSHGDLRSNVAELTPDTKEQISLLLEWSHILVLINLAFKRLLICISDFRERCKPEENDQQNNEAGHSEVGPLYVLQPRVCVHGVGEEDTRGQEGSDKGSNTLDSLS